MSLQERSIEYMYAVYHLIGGTILIIGVDRMGCWRDAYDKLRDGALSV